MIDGPESLRTDLHVTLCPAASLGSRIAESRSEKTFIFEPINRRIERAWGRFAAGRFPDLVANCNTVSRISQPKDGE